MQPFEKLGAFYIGKEYDLKTKQRLDDVVMYDARDLTTHAVVVGMTGSGKTGLCVDILEEAAIDHVPAILIDPKGDITNLLLTFPELLPEDFQPWVNIDDARRKGMSIEEYAAKMAGVWRKGLAEWGEGPERIKMLKESADFRIYTPGSDAGLPISILSSLNAPALAWEGNEEELREQIQGTVSALLGLVKIDADPLRSREHILLSNIFEYYWKQGENLDMATLIMAIQNPPISKLGVFDVDTFFPAKERFELAMDLNAIMAAPSFQSWLEGDPLDINTLLFDSNGKPRHSIFYIAHLSDPERMFFVTLLLEQLVTWMRQQNGTTSLRALMYMDEVFGFFPPTATPPSKKPLLTLMKQARAYGLGVILTTQNPADLDYKGLTNAGTWFIGKLQAERDKERVLAGLESASAESGQGMNKQQLGKIMSSLGSRVFLLHNVHENEPVIFQTRWAMSYLRGPLTRDQVSTLMEPVKQRERTTPQASQTAAPAGAGIIREQAPAAAEKDHLPDGYSSHPPALPPNVPQVFFPVNISPNRAISLLEKEEGRTIKAEEVHLVYEPGLYLSAEVAFVDRRKNVNELKEMHNLVHANDLGTVIRWDRADEVTISPDDLETESDQEDAIFGELPRELSTASKLKSLKKDYADYLYHEMRLPLYFHPALKLYSEAGESERDFKVRLAQVAREKRDAEVDKLRKRYAVKLNRLRKRLQREKDELTEDKIEYDARKKEEMVSGAETVLGMLGIFGRRKSVSTAMRKRRMTARAKADIEESENEIQRLQKEISEMEDELKQEAEDIAARWEEMLDNIETYQVKPRRTDVAIDMVAVAWLPYWEIVYEARGGRVSDRIPAWQMD
ncbi:MAG: hypothetical protein DSY55_02180 [Clostridia bacterium]|nr:MAG: hypothetical protein DSY55_02180 [Clostridia bacterium]